MFYTPGVPNYAKQDLKRLGYNFDDINTSIKDAIKKNNSLIWYEAQLNIILEHIDDINNTTQRNVLIVDHHMSVHHLLKQVDEKIKDKNKFVIFGYYPMLNVYNNITSYSVSGQELQCHHDFVYYLIKKWKSNKKNNPSHDLLFLSANKNDEQRNWIYQTIISNNENSFLKVQQKTAKELYDKRTVFNNWVNEKFDGSNMLGGFGNGSPRFDLYDNVFGEIVLETSYNGPYIHLTEKTWKPISCGVPAIFLVNKNNIEWLEQQKYVLEPTELYKELKTNNNYKNLPEIVKPYITNLEKYKTVLENMAQQNFKHFWRINSYWESFGEAFEKIFGYSLIKDLENKLKEI